jgi:RNA polymerase sigma-70 factor (ECF subfamily)
VALSVVPRAVPETDAELVSACVAGDVAAQRTLFRREYARVNATVYRIVGSSRDADDLVQETFIAVFRGLSRFRGDSMLSSWIDRIAVRVVFLRLRAFQRLSDGKPLREVRAERLPAALHRPADEHRRWRHYELAHSILREVPPDARLGLPA